jgi:hypothetical protein
MKTSHVRRLTAAGAMVCAIAPLGSALAEPSSADRSLATQLFREGRALLEQGHVPQACRKLEESHRLDPGGGTLLNLALCHEKEGRTATAWAEFTEGLGIARRDERPLRVEYARNHIALLEPVLSRLFVQVPPTTDLPDLEVRRDGTALGRAAWGVGMAVDPGDHLVEASAPGKLSWKQAVNVGPKGDNRTVVIPALETAPVPVTTTASPTPPPTTLASSAIAAAAPTNSDAAAPPDSAATARGASPSPLTWIALGVGVAATGVGTYFGIQAISLKRDADAACPPSGCTVEGARKNDDAIKASNLSTAGFGLGIVGIGVGVILLATSSGGSHVAMPKAEGVAQKTTIAPTVSVESGGAKLMFSGRF